MEWLESDFGSLVTYFKALILGRQIIIKLGYKNGQDAKNAYIVEPGTNNISL